MRTDTLILLRPWAKATTPGWHVSVSGVSQAYGDARDTDMSALHVSVSGVSSRLNKGSRLNKADCRGDHRGVVASIDSAEVQRVNGRYGVGWGQYI